MMVDQMNQVPSDLQLNNVKFLPIVNACIHAIGIAEQFDQQVKLNVKISSGAWTSLMILDTLCSRGQRYHLFC